MDRISSGAGSRAGTNGGDGTNAGTESWPVRYVKASHIAYVENNLRNPSLRLLRRLVEALGLDRREALFLAHPGAQYLTDDSSMPGKAKTGDSWKQFSANHAMLRRHNVSPAELRVLKQVSLLESVSHPRHFLFVLNSIRQAGSGRGL